MSKQPWKSVTESDVTEHVVGSAAHRVDKEKGIIYGVKILGTHSGNGYEYTAEALGAAAKLYAGRPVNIDHGSKPGASRSMADRFGKVLTAEARQDGVYGDIQYNRQHPLAGMVAEAAESMPDTLGMSQVARVRWRNPNKTVAESILAVKSVDVVADPATTSSLFESQQGSPNVATFKTVRDSLKAGTKVHQLYSWLCEDEMGMGDMPMEAPPDVAAATDPDQALKDGIVSAMQAALEAFKAGDMDSVAMVAKIKELAKTFDKAAAPAEKPAEVPAEEPAAEHRKPAKPSADPLVADLQEQLTALRRKDEARELCDAEGIKPSAVLLKHLLRCENEAEMKELIQESKKATGDEPKAPPAPGTKPKSGLQTTVTESLGKPPTNPDEAKRRWGGKVAAKN